MSTGMGVDVVTTLCLHPHGTSGSQAAGLMTSVPLSSLMSHLHTGCPQHVAGRAIKYPLSTLELRVPWSRFISDLWVCPVQQTRNYLRSSHLPTVLALNTVLAQGPFLWWAHTPHTVSQRRWPLPQGLSHGQKSLVFQQPWLDISQLPKQHRTTHDYSVDSWHLVVLARPKAQSIDAKCYCREMLVGHSQEPAAHLMTGLPAHLF